MLFITNTSYRQKCPPRPWAQTWVVDSVAYHEPRVFSGVVHYKSYQWCCCSPRCEASMALSSTHMRWGIDGVINHQHALSIVSMCFWLSLSTYIADHQPCIIIAHQAVLSITNTSACIVDQHSIDAWHVCYCPTNYATDLSHQTCVFDP